MKRIFLSIGPGFPRLAAVIALLPGMFLLGMGLLALFAPKLLAFLAAVFFLYLGAFAMLAGWKILQWRRKAVAFFDQVGTIVELRRDVETDGFSRGSAARETQADSRKIIVH